MTVNDAVDKLIKIFYESVIEIVMFVSDKSNKYFKPIYLFPFLFYFFLRKRIT